MIVARNSNMKVKDRGTGQRGREGCAEWVFMRAVCMTGIGIEECETGGA